MSALGAVLCWVGRHEMQPVIHKSESGHYQRYLRCIRCRYFDLGWPHR